MGDGDSISTSDLRNKHNALDLPNGALDSGTIDEPKYLYLQVRNADEPLQQIFRHDVGEP